MDRAGVGEPKGVECNCANFKQVMFSVQDLTRFILDAALTDGLRYGFVERTQTPAPTPETEVWVLAPGAPVPWEV